MIKRVAVDSISASEKTAQMKTISWDDFERVELRVGTIIEVADFPEAGKPAYKITVDFGLEIGVKRSSAQIMHLGPGHA